MAALSGRAASLLFSLVGILLLRVSASGVGILIVLLLAQLDRPGARVPAWVVGLTSALFYASELLGAPLFGMLSDRNGRRRYLLVSPIFGAVGAVVVLAAPLVPVVLVSRLFQGLSTAASAPASLGYMADATSGDQSLRGRVMALFEVTTVAGIVGGVAIGGVLWDHLGLRAFLPVLALYALSWLAFTRVRDVLQAPRAEHPHAGLPARGPHATPHGALLEALRLPGVLAFIPAWLAVNAILGGWAAHIGFLLKKADDPAQYLVGGFSGTQVGLFAAVVGALFVVGIVLWGQALGRLGALGAMRLGLVGLLALCPATYWLNHASPGQSARITLALAAAGLALLVASGFTPAALAHLANISEVSTGDRGAVMGLYSVLLGLGQLLGAMLAAPLVQHFEADGLILLTLLLTAVSALGVVILGARPLPVPAHPALRVEPEA